MIALPVAYLLVALVTIVPFVPSIRRLGELPLDQAGTSYPLNRRRPVKWLFKYHAYTPLNEIPDLVIQTALAVEDQRFYEHNGVDGYALRRTLRGLWNEHRVAGGASTITQQLARSLFLSKDRTLFRKTRELFLTLILERCLTKERILELYLNVTVYEMEGWGVKSASRALFGKRLDQLSRGEAALLVSLASSPISVRHPPADSSLIEKRNRALQRMREYRVIDDKEWQQAVVEPVRIQSQQSFPAINSSTPFPSQRANLPR